MTTYNGVPFCLSDEAIMEPLWRLRRPFQKELTFTRWKDGIDIDYPTPELRALAEHFYRAGMAAMAEREGLKQDVIEAAKAMRDAGEQEREIFEAFDATLAALDEEQT